MISHNHKLVFIHIPKCAGTSVTHALLELMGHEKDEALHDRRKYLFEGYCHAWQFHYQHATLNQAYATHPEIDDYFKFTFIRNPWDRAVSDYHWMKKDRHLHTTTFEDYLRVRNGYERFNHTTNYEGRGDHFLPQTDFFDDRIDFVGRFENLSNEFYTILESLNISPVLLPHKNMTKRDHYSKYYDDTLRELVAQKYKKDIDYGQYTFES